MQGGKILRIKTQEQQRMKSLESSIMQKKNNRIQKKMRQRQRQTRKMVIILTACFATCMSIALTVFFHSGNVEESQAAVSIYTVVDETPVVEKTLEAPLLRQGPAIGPNTILVRAVKSTHAPAAHN